MTPLIDLPMSAIVALVAVVIVGYILWFSSYIRMWREDDPQVSIIEMIRIRFDSSQISILLTVLGVIMMLGAGIPNWIGFALVITAMVIEADLL